MPVAFVFTVFRTPFEAFCHRSNFWTSAVLTHQTIINSDINITRDGLGAINTTAIEFLDDGVVYLEGHIALHLLIASTRHEIELTTVGIAMRVIFSDRFIRSVNTR